ncbi:MAG: FAD-dependent oxidoreductase [Chloroflexia bacterium]
MSNNYDYDVIVIGGGGTGYAAASTAARRGVRTAMVEGGKLGGACLNVGCVPTKTLLRSAQVADTARRAAEFGVRVGEVSVDFAVVTARMRDIVDGMSGEGPVKSLRDQNIEFFPEWASFEDAHTLRIGERRVTTRNVVIASGSAPVVPNIPGLKESGFITSDGALALDTLSESVVIVGGGAVGCEFASIFNSFGSDVTIVSSRLLEREDEELGAELAEAFARRGIRVLTDARLTRVDRDGGRRVCTVRLADGADQTLTSDVLLVAVGRRPNLDKLSPEAAGVELDEGRVKVNDEMRTTTTNIWAAGDAAGRLMYTHAGDMMGEVAGWNAAGGEPARRARLDVVPRPVYSIPAVAAVGLTIKEAEQVDCDVEIARVKYSDLSRAIINGETEGWCRIIARCDDGVILGASIIGERADEMIGELAFAMTAGVSSWVLGDSLHPYPTLSELVRWTADQLGKDDNGEDRPRPAPATHHPYSAALAEHLTRHTESDGLHSPASSVLTQAALERMGYGDEDDCADSS